MRLISMKPIKEFIKAHPESKATLLAICKVLESTDFEDFSELRSALRQVDYVKPFHVFNVGRAYRLVAVIHYNRRRVFVRHVLMHAEYDRGKWKPE